MSKYTEQALQTGTLSLCGHINDSLEEKLVLTLVVGPIVVVYSQQCLTVVHPLYT